MEKISKKVMMGAVALMLLSFLVGVFVTKSIVDDYAEECMQEYNKLVNLYNTECVWNPLHAPVDNMTSGGETDVGEG